MLKGVKNVLFSGEGLFVTKIRNISTTGDIGYVWIQGLESGRFVHEIFRRGGGSRDGSGGGLGMLPWMLPLGGGEGSGGGAAAGDAASGVAGGAASGVATEAMAGGSAGADPSSSSSPESPETLFGDAAPPADSFDNDTFESGGGEPVFEDETTFDTESVGEVAEEAASDRGLFGSIWDAISGDDE